MKQAIKKSLCIVLTAFMLLTAAPLSGFVGLEWPELNLPEWNLPDIDFNFSADAAEVVNSGTCGENLTWTLDSDGVLTIAGTGAMRNYSSSSYSVPWYSNRSAIKTVIIENGVTSIGNYAFWKCTSLTSVTIPDSVTSIWNYAFWKCTSLTSVTIPDSVTSIREYAFAGCTSLTSVTIPDSVTSIGYSAFRDCTSLTSVTIPDSVTSIGSYAFLQCTSLTSVTIPDSVTSIGVGAFENCTNLTSITIPDSVTSIGSSAFCYCTSLTSVTIPDSVTSIGYSAFRACTSLASVTIPDSVTSIGHSAFSGCTSLTDITVDADNTTYCSEDGVLFNKSKTELIQYLVGNARTSYTIPDSVTSIGDSAFEYCTSLTSVIIGDSVTSIGSSAFEYCTSLTSVTIGDSVTSIGDWAFYGCTSLTAIAVDENNTAYSSLNGVLYNKDKTILVQYAIGKKELTFSVPDSVTTIGRYAFYSCETLVLIDIPDSVTSIEDGAFSHCKSLYEITIPNNVTMLNSDVFAYCDSLRTITIGKGIRTISNDAFYECNFSSVNITDLEAWCNITFEYNKFWGLSNPLDGAYLYLNGLRVSELSIPETITEIKDYAFFGCLGITSVTIPDSVVRIGKEAFAECSNLHAVTVGKGLTVIDDEAFSDCSYISDLYISDIAAWCNIDFVTYDSHPLYTSYSISQNLYLNGEIASKIIVPESVVEIKKNTFRYIDSVGEIIVENEECQIADTADVFASNIVLRGHDNSTVQSYAEKYDRVFISIDGADSDIVISGNCGENVKWELTRSGELRIDGAGKMETYGSAADVPWYKYRGFIKTVPIGEDVSSIANYAFYGQKNITSVTIPDLVNEIANSAFADCTSLREIKYSENIITIGEKAFSNCVSLTSVSIPKSVTTIGASAFESCTALKGVYITDLTAWCNIDFQGTMSFWSSDHGTNPLEYAGNLYLNGELIEDLVIPDGITEIKESAFIGLNVNSVTIADGVTSIGWAAFYESSLKSIIIPPSVKSIGVWAFMGCDALTDVHISDLAAWCNIHFAYIGFGLSGTYYEANPLYPSGNLFLNGELVTDIVIPDGVTELKAFVLASPSLKTVCIPASVTSIGSYAFYNCTSFTSVTIPDSVTSIGDRAFSNCPALVIRGYLDSYAQQHAEENGIPFIALNADPFVNLSGSSVTPTAEFTVYGLATPLQAVSLYCEDAVIGAATAGANGRYTLTATLPAPEEGKTYTVVAKVTVDEVTKESEPLQVTYNSDSATLNTLVFTHSCYDYTITSETLNFVAPTISINTNRPMYFTITLNGKTPDSLTVVSTKNGVRKTMPATYNAADGKWYASGWFDPANKSYVPGEITLEYDDGKVIEVPFKAKFIVDPSGYVYEAVKSNVVEDAIAIVQYKDENGNAAFWDADAYDQVNPQITKADGYFSWFVPEGEWQVKVIKVGYQTALSDWYTVPPEVTGLYIPLVTYNGAEVDYCNVFADYAEIKFSQYMQIDSINSTNITFGEYTGTWEAVDKEVSGTDENVYYATTFRFTPDTAFSGDITVNIANVTNYAGYMSYDYDAYTETVTVTAPIENFTLSATELTLAAGTQATVELDAGAAAAGKTVSVQFGNEAVASAVKTFTLDENGKASLTVNGNAFGATTATFALAGTSLTAECTVTVTAPTAVEPAFTLGDVDGDKAITASDARLALRAAVMLETLTEAQTQAADADKNGKIEAADARLILRAAVGLETLQ